MEFFLNDLNWQWLKSECMAWMSSKANDVQATEDLIKLKNEAVKMGFERIQVSQAIHKLRKILDNEEQQKPSLGISSEVIQPEEEDSKGDYEYEESKATDSKGLNPSGGKARKSKVSILDIADSKLKR